MHRKGAQDARDPEEHLKMVVAAVPSSVMPSCRMSAQIIARLKANEFPHVFQLQEYADAGHSVFGPPIDSASPVFASLGFWGGSPAANNAARVDSWPKAMSFIDAALRPSGHSRP